MSTVPPPASGRFGRGGGLTARLFLFVVLPLTAFLVVIAFGGLALHSRAMRSLVAERMGRTVHAAADAINVQLAHRAASVQALALHAQGAPSPARALAEFSFMGQDFEAGLALVAPDGSVLASSGPTDWSTQPVTSLVAQARATGAAQYSQAFHDLSQQADVVLVAFSARNGRAAVGAFLPSALGARVLADANPPGSQVHARLIDPSFQTLYSLGPDTDASPVPDQPGVSEGLHGESGVILADVAGEEHVIAYCPFPPHGWALVMEEPWESVDNPLLRGTQAAPLILLPALLFALLAIAFAVRQVVQPLQALESRAVSIGRGDFAAIEQSVGGIDEVKSLQHTMIHMAHQLGTHQESNRRYIGALTRSQEDERRRLARELHDDTVQALIALDQRARLTQMAVKKGSADAAERLADLRRWTLALLDGVRRVIRALRPIYLEDLGLPSALETLAADMEKASGLKVHLQTQGRPVRLSPEHEIAIYRIAQEAVNNVGRHARAESVHLHLTFNQNRFSLLIRDDGVGFEVPARLNDLASSDHYGLLGMQERAELIGARLRLESEPGKGTSLQLDLPL